MGEIVLLIAAAIGLPLACILVAARLLHYFVALKSPPIQRAAVQRDLAATVAPRASLSADSLADRLTAAYFRRGLTS